MIWVNVGPPPSVSAVAVSKGKLTKQQRALAQLRQKKIDALKLAVAFAVAVKHHLRDEPGIDYDDLKDVLPEWFARFDEIGFGTSSSTPCSPSDHQSLANADLRWKQSEHGLTFSGNGVSVSEAGPHTPLLGDNHRTIEFHAYSAKVSMPLPLV